MRLRDVSKNSLMISVGQQPKKLPFKEYVLFPIYCLYVSDRTVYPSHFFLNINILLGST